MTAAGTGLPHRAGGSLPAAHSHLWRLPDGTGLHAPAGVLLTDEATGQLCCHLCGDYFVSLGVHVRVHGHTAGTYRLAMQLAPGQSLAASRPGRAGRKGRMPTAARAMAGPPEPAGAAGDPAPPASRAVGVTLLIPAAGVHGGRWLRGMLNLTA